MRIRDWSSDVCSSDLLLLVSSKLSKRFGGLQALSDVSFSICKGDIYGLIGPNGAGKTTLFNVLPSLYVPESGTCNFMGHQLTRLKPHEIAVVGLARTFQNRSEERRVGKEGVSTCISRRWPRN